MRSTLAITGTAALFGSLLTGLLFAGTTDSMASPPSHPAPGSSPTARPSASAPAPSSPPADPEPGPSLSDPAPTFPTAEPAKVEFDFDTNVGFVNESDIRQGFDWDAPKLTANADRIEFQQGKLIQDTYSVTCDRSATPFKAVHVRQDARFFLIGAAVSGRPFAGTDAPQPTTSGSPTPGLLGFRIHGTWSGISSTTVPPFPGTECPKATRGKEVSTSRMVSTTATNTLIAIFGEQDVTLLKITTGPEIND